jgi:hypothetical protein
MHRLFLRNELSAAEFLTREHRYPGNQRRNRVVTLKFGSGSVGIVFRGVRDRLRMNTTARHSFRNRHYI